MSRCVGDTRTFRRCSSCTWLVAALCLFASESLLRAAAPAPRPNLLFILTEDHGAQLGFLGTPGLQTPHIDSLAKSGVYFDRAFVVYPVCSASKASIYTRRALVVHFSRLNCTTSARTRTNGATSPLIPNIARTATGFLVRYVSGSAAPATRRCTHRRT